MTKVIIDVVICVVWLAACILLIRQMIIGKIGKYIGTAILFILFTALSAGSSFGRILATEIINENVASLDQTLKDQIFNVVKWIVLVIHLIVWLFMAIHLCRFVFAAKRKPQTA